MKSILNLPLPRFSPKSLRITAELLLALALLLASGCGITAKLGRMPDTSRLESLKLKTSTKSEVLEALGSPKGGGRSQFPPEERPRELWYYYYEEGTLKDSQRIFLFVFFDEGRYDGHLWFSTLPHIQPVEK